MAWYDRYIDQAIGVALAGHPRREALLGCVALRADGAIVTAYNIPSFDKEPRAHAEARALRKAGKGAIIFVARVTRDGRVACAKPCKDCARLIRRMNAKVFHT